MTVKISHGDVLLNSKLHIIVQVFTDSVVCIGDVVGDKVTFRRCWAGNLNRYLLRRLFYQSESGGRRR